MAEPLKIDIMYAFIAEEPDGSEGVTAFQSNKGLWMPMVGADIARIESLKEIAQQLANASKCKIRLCRFIVREEVEEISPRR